VGIEPGKFRSTASTLTVSTIQSVRYSGCMACSLF